MDGLNDKTFIGKIEKEFDFLLNPIVNRTIAGKESSWAA